MSSARSRLRDRRRLATLADFDVFNHPDLDSLEPLLTVVAELTGISNVVINIIDAKQQVPLADIGAPASAIPAGDGFCHKVVETGELIHTMDATADPRFAGSPYATGDTAVRRYAAAPLKAESGDVLGALCVYDEHPGELTDRQLEALQVLADHVMQVLHLSRTRRQLERQAAESAASEHRQRRLLEASPDGFFQLNSAGVIVTWSPSAARLFGYPSADAIGQRALDLLLPVEQRSVVQSQLVDMVEAGRLADQSQRMTLTRRDGEPRCFELSLWMETNPEFSLNAFARDVTDEEAASRRIEEAETRWRLAFEAAPIGMAIQRMGTGGLRYERVNRAMCDMTGYSPAELLDLGPLGVADPDDVEEYQAGLRQLAAGRRNEFRRTMRYRHADGHAIYVEASSVMAPGEDRSLVVTQAQDVTEQRETLASLHEKAALLDLTREAVFVRRIDGTVVFWNHGAEEMYGIPAARALGRVTHQLLETEFPEPFEQIRKQLVEIGHWEGLLKHTDLWGHRRTVMSRWAYHVDDTGEEVILEINSDVTAETEAQARQRTAEALFEIAFVHAPIGVGILGTSGADRGRWLQANDALRQLTPGDDDLIGRPVAAMFDFEDSGPVMRRLANLFEGREERWDGEWRVPTPGGHRYLAARCIAIERGDAQGERIVVVQVEDVTRHRARELWLRGQAVQDSLTKLPNRLALNELIEHEISELATHGRPLGVLFVDLDGFKAVNDRFGHAAGDDVLIEVARKLQEAVPETATVARLGGDEFVVVAPDHDEAGARQLTEVLRETTVVTCGTGSDAFDVTASIGWAVTADPSVASQALLGKADSMMYEFKHAR